MAANQISIGIIGAGRGLTFGEAFGAFPESRVVGVADRFPARLGAARRVCPEAHCCTDYAELLAQPGLNVVVVASEGPAHPEHVVQALEAGKDVLSEVPAGYTIAGHLAIVEAVRRTGRRYMLAENCVYWSFVDTWRRMYEAGEFGELSYAEAEYLHDVAEMHFVDAEGRRRGHAEAASDPSLVRSWRARMHPIQYITHSLGPLLWVTGDRCVSVSCLAAPANRDPECGSPDLESALLHTAAGRAFRIVCGFNVVHPTGHRYQLMGSRGTAVWEQSNLDAPKLLHEGEHAWTAMDWPMERREGPEEARGSGHGGADWFVARAFLDALLSDEEPPIDVHRSMDFSLPGLCAALSAERKGEVVEIPDTREEGALAAWAARQGREPWPFGGEERRGW